MKPRTTLRIYATINMICIMYFAGTIFGILPFSYWLWAILVIGIFYSLIKQWQTRKKIVENEHTN